MFLDLRFELIGKKMFQQAMSYLPFLGPNLRSRSVSFTWFYVLYVWYEVLSSVMVFRFTFTRILVYASLFRVSVLLLLAVFSAYN